jgi:hypothetical protein
LIFVRILYAQREEVKEFLARENKWREKPRGNRGKPTGNRVMREKPRNREGEGTGEGE